MTLSVLCSLLSKECSDVECSVIFSQFFHELKELDDIAVLPLKKTDIESVLKPHCKCRIMSIYEYICNKHSVPKDDEVMSMFGDLYCSKYDNDYYNSIKGIFHEDLATKLYSESLKNSIPEFKKHGIIASEFNYAV